MSSIPSRSRNTPSRRNQDITALIPDFPFHYGRFLSEAGNWTSLFQLPVAAKNKRVLVVGAGAAGAVAAYELLRMGLKPVLVEASDRYGGRLNAQLRGDDEHQVFAEMGAMRFPKSGKAGQHYFEKVGMFRNSEPFPNPGNAATPSTVVDYRGEQVYYESGSGSEYYPVPTKYTELEDDMFGNPEAGKKGFLNSGPVFLELMQGWMTEGVIDEASIRRVWRELLTTHHWDDISFYGALTQISPWTPEKINLFGQIGFGTGGWNTDYPNCILEVLRVLYTGLDVGHQLIRDGTTTLPARLITETPRSLHDGSDDSTKDLSVLQTSSTFLSTYFRSASPLHKEVTHIRRTGQNTLLVTIRENDSGDEEEVIEFDAVIYTPHVRILDKFRHYNDGGQYKETTELLDADLWEAIEYTHYMQSSKIFMATTEPFWKFRLPADGDVPGKYPMSVTLSDRLTRGTYLVDYGNSSGAVKGSGIFLSYTWNDDSLKFLGDRNIPGELLTHANMCRTVLQDIYPDLRLTDYLVQSDKSEIEINWENEAFYLGAFKMNLPGQYEYQRRLFSQFMTGVKEGTPDPFVLAGDDISWIAGWVEGAITSAINAVNKVAVLFNGSEWGRLKGPIARWDELEPIPLHSFKLDVRGQPHANHRESSEVL